MKNKSLIVIICINYFMNCYNVFSNEKFSIKIISKPEFSDIFIDNNFVGISPQVVELEAGKYDVLVKHPISGSMKKIVEVKRDGEIEQTFQIGIKNQFKTNLLDKQNQKKEKWVIKPIEKNKNYIYYTMFSIIAVSAALYFGKNKLDEGRGSTISIKSR